MKVKLEAILLSEVFECTYLYFLRYLKSFHGCVLVIEYFVNFLVIPIMNHYHSNTHDMHVRTYVKVQYT